DITRLCSPGQADGDAPGEVDRYRERLSPSRGTNASERSTEKVREPDEFPANLLAPPAKTLPGSTEVFSVLRLEVNPRCRVRHKGCPRLDRGQCILIAATVVGTEHAEVVGGGVHDPLQEGFEVALFRDQVNLARYFEPHLFVEILA